MNYTSKVKKKEYIYNDPKYSEEQKVSVFTLQRENEILQNKIKQLSETNKNLMEQITQLCQYKLNTQDVMNENSKLKISLDNNEKILKNLHEKNEKDNIQISQLEHKIENLNFQIEKLNNIINEHEGDKIEYKARIDKLLIFKDKFEEIDILYNQLKKENKKLKKNLQLFYQENHLAALKLKEYEKKLNIQENHYNNDKKENSQMIDSVKIMEKINTLKKQMEDFGKKKTDN
jgi:chromosome segregation ATPase